MVYIYILKLIDDKYYVGKTSNPKFRVKTHFDKNASMWTTKYSPIRLFELIPDCDEYDEDKYTIKYMNLYGINNVRGGSFCKLVLDQSDIHTINRMLIGSSNRCYNCHKAGHFIKDCKEEKQLESIDEVISPVTITEDFINVEEEEIKEEEKEPQIYNTKKGFFENLSIIATRVMKNLELAKEPPKKVDKCTRCKRYGHLRENCYANTSLKGNKLKKKY